MKAGRQAVCIHLVVTTRPDTLTHPPPGHPSLSALIFNYSQSAAETNRPVFCLKLLEQNIDKNHSVCLTFKLIKIIRFDS